MFVTSNCSGSSQKIFVSAPLLPIPPVEAIINDGRDRSGTSFKYVYLIVVIYQQFSQPSIVNICVRKEQFFTEKFFCSLPIFSVDHFQVLWIFQRNKL